MSDRHVVSVAVLGIFVLLAAGSIDTKSKTSGSTSGTSGGTPASSVTATVSASTLYADYEANEVAADDKYKGRVLRVNGTVDNIGKDILDSMYVTFKVEKHGFMSVQCFFPDSAESSLSKLRQGQPLTVVGRCEGKFGNVLLKDCVVE